MYNHECIIIVKKGIYFHTLNIRFHDATFILEIDNKSNGKINRTNLVELIFRNCMNHRGLDMNFLQRLPLIILLYMMLNFQQNYQGASLSFLNDNHNYYFNFAFCFFTQ